LVRECQNLAGLHSAVGFIVWVNKYANMSARVLLSPDSEVFLVKCADYKCLAVRGANGRWKSFYDDAELPRATEPVFAIPAELILPFLPDIQRGRLCPVPLPARKQIQMP
jgi:hypothetical protein